MTLLNSDPSRLVFRRGGRWAAVRDCLAGMSTLVTGLAVANIETGFVFWLSVGFALLGGVMFLSEVRTLVRGDEKLIEIDKMEVRVTHVISEKRRSWARPLSDYVGFVHFESVSDEAGGEPAQVFLVAAVGDGVLELDSGSYSVDEQWEACVRFAESCAMPVLDNPPVGRFFGQGSIDKAVAMLREVSAAHGQSSNKLNQGGGLVEMH